MSADRSLADRPLAGRVAVVTGAARGQGRSHAVRLAADGADVIALDLCAEVATTDYDGATADDLAATTSMVEALGGRCASASVDVRDLPALSGALEQGLAALTAAADGPATRFVDVVVANAGIAGGAPIEFMPAEAWQEMIDVNLTGVWNTVKAVVPSMLANPRILANGGTGTASVVLISSANAGLKAPPNLAHYAAAKHGVVGIMRSLANELGPRGIRVNTVHPTAVDTPMIHNDFTYRLFRPDLEAPGRDDVVDLFRSYHSLPVPWIDPSDVSEAVAFLASDASRMVTGVMLPVDAGLSSR
jgi:SDR family mycofactocin-dependent oxidoreductase